MTNDLAIRILTGDVLGTTEQTKEAITMAVRALSKPDVTDTNVGDTISRQAAVYAVDEMSYAFNVKTNAHMAFIKALADLPSAQPEIIRCKDCKHWRQQTNYQGAPLSFGFCESDDMWQSLYGETYEVAHIDTDDDFYCGYAKRRSDE